MRLPNIFARDTVPQTFKAGQTIFSAGDSGAHMYVVRSGMVDLLKAERIIETVGPEGFFGEVALIDTGPRGATARAQTDCELVPIDEKQFVFMVGETPFFALVVLRKLAERLRR